MNPKWRILEYGYYARYLRLWKKCIPKERFKVFLFKEAVVREPQKAITQLYDYLGLDSNFTPESIRTSAHKSWTMTRIIFNYYISFLGSRFQLKADKYLSTFWDRYDFLKKYEIRRDDIKFLQSIYLPEKEELESLIGRELECWDYGASNI